MLGRYQLCGHLASGGMADVYVARLLGEEGFERVVAIKMLKGAASGGTSAEHMFIDEARILARLSHSGIVQIYDLGRQDGTIFIAMELIFGQSLADVWDACRVRGVRLRGDVVAWIGARVAEALHYAHDARSLQGVVQNLIHRDVNPSNIIITYDGHVKLIDFGLVKGDDRLSRTDFGIVKGKVAYLSPEQAHGHEIDRRSDLFQLGTTLWELSTDQRLFKRETNLETVNAIREGIVPDPTTIVRDYPSLLWLVLRRALAYDPSERYATAEDFARDLDGVARVQGSILQTATLAEIMEILFGEERAREQAWFQKALGEPAPSALPVLRPGGEHHHIAQDAATLDSPFLIPLPTRAPPPALPEPSSVIVAPDRRFSPQLLAAAALLVMVMIAVAVALFR